ncbi:MAG: roadblock/LC7 domain-containing protein [Leptothrix ochracea]|uniref:roadblock/LC7 domain-containing protein n=1 Tax=Leptothrix ochracea TaxID=735331 RepID=UPI0034E232B2
MRSQVFQPMLKDLHENSPEIEASAILTVDGLTVTSLLSASMDPRRQGTMRAAAMLAMGQQAVCECACGHFEHVVVHGKEGSVLLVSITTDVVMLVLIKTEVSWAAFLQRVEQATQAIRRVI